MPVPLFGWSAGDIVVSIKILYHVADAFNESGGAKDQYAETSTWLRSFAEVLERVKEHVDDKPTAKYTENIKQQISNIGPHYDQFEKYLQRFEPALSSTKSTVSSVRQAVKKVRWAVKELKGHVAGLKAAVSGPLMSINLLVSLQNLNDLGDVSRKVVTLPLASDFNTIEQSVKGLGVHLQRTELGLVDLQNSVNEQASTLRNLRTLSADDISAEGQKPFETQEAMLLAVLEAMDRRRSAVHDNLIDLSQRLDEVGHRLSDSSNKFADILDDQKTTLQACQIHLEYIQKAAQNIDQGSKLEVARPLSENWLEHMKAAGLIFSALAGVSNMLAIQTLQDEGSGRIPQQSPDRLQAGFNVPVLKKNLRGSTVPSALLQRWLETPRNEEVYSGIAFSKRRDSMSSAKRGCKLRL